MDLEVDLKVVGLGNGFGLRPNISKNRGVGMANVENREISFLKVARKWAGFKKSNKLTKLFPKMEKVRPLFASFQKWSFLKGELPSKMSSKWILPWYTHEILESLGFYLNRDASMANARFNFSISCPSFLFLPNY